MKELTNPEEQLVTIKELVDLFGVSNRSIRRAIKKYFPKKLKKGKTTYLNELEVTIVKKELSNHHNIGGIAYVDIRPYVEIYAKRIGKI